MLKIIFNLFTVPDPGEQKVALNFRAMVFDTIISYIYDVIVA